MKDNLLDSFIVFVKRERRLSDNTVRAYNLAVREFIDFVNKHGIGIKNIDSKILSEFIASLKNRGLSVNSILQKMSAIGSFIKYLFAMGIINTNPYKEVALPKKVKRLPAFLNKEEVEAILDSINGNKKNNIRDRAIFELLYSCGLRVSELLSLTIDDLFLSHLYIRVRGKGNKERIVPISTKTKTLIVEYMDRVRSTFKTNENALFLNKSGKPISRIYIWKLVKRYSNLVGIDKNVSPHTLRHTFATHMLENGASINVVQKILGHENLSTTQIYTHISFDKIRKEYESAHPLERKS